MRFGRIPLVVFLSVCVGGVLAFVSAGVSAGAADVAQGSTALERGYRTGYSDGYTAGYKDIATNAPRDYQSKDDYQKADRSFNEAWGTLEDYRDGYQQGFEAGYAAGYERQQFNSNLPTGFKRRGGVGPTASDSSSAPASVPANAPSTVTTQTTGDQNTVPAPTGNGSLSIPRNTVLALELTTPVSTEASQRGDRIEARVVEPAEFAGYIVDGRVAQVKRPGKVKGVAQIQLSFDQIRSTDNRAAQLHAELIEIAPMGGDNEPQVDAEGGVRGRDSTKDDAAKVGAASGIGAIIGAIAGGGKGAAIGAVIGGGAGTGAVMTQRGKDIRLERGTHLKIRTSTDTSVL